MAQASTLKDFVSSFFLLELLKGFKLTGRHFFQRKITVQLIVEVAGLCSWAPAFEVTRPAGIAPRRNAGS